MHIIVVVWRSRVKKETKLIDAMIDCLKREVDECHRRALDDCVRKRVICGEDKSDGPKLET